MMEWRIWNGEWGMEEGENENEKLKMGGKK